MKEVARLDEGTIVQVLGKEKRVWLRIRRVHPHGTVDGYLHQDVVSIEGAPPNWKMRPKGGGGGPDTPFDDEYGD